MVAEPPSFLSPTTEENNGIITEDHEVQKPTVSRMNEARNNLKEKFSERVYMANEYDNYYNQSLTNEYDIYYNDQTLSKEDQLIEKIFSVRQCKRMDRTTGLRNYRKHELLRGQQLQNYLAEYSVPAVFTSVNPMGVWFNMISEAANKIGDFDSFQKDWNNKQQDRDLNFSVFARVENASGKSLKGIREDIQNDNDLVKTEGNNLISSSPSLDACVASESFISFYSGEGGSANSGESGSRYGDKWSNTIWNITKEILLKKIPLGNFSVSFWNSSSTKISSDQDHIATSFDQLTEEKLNKKKELFQTLFESFVTGLDKKKNLMTVIALYEHLDEKVYISGSMGMTSSNRKYRKSSERFYENEERTPEEIEAHVKDLLEIQKDAKEDPEERQTRVLVNNYIDDSCKSGAKQCHDASLGFYRVAERKEIDVYNKAFDDIVKTLQHELQLSSS